MITNQNDLVLEFNSRLFKIVKFGLFTHKNILRLHKSYLNYLNLLYFCGNCLCFILCSMEKRKPYCLEWHGDDE